MSVGVESGQARQQQEEQTPSRSQGAQPSSGPPSTGSLVAQSRGMSYDQGVQHLSPQAKHFEILGARFAYDDKDIVMESARPNPVFAGKNVGSDALQAMYQNGLMSTIDLATPSNQGWCSTVPLPLVGGIPMTFSPRGRVTLGGHVALTGLQVTGRSGDVVTAGVEAEVGGGVVADFGMEVGTASGLVDPTITGTGSGSAVMAAPKSKGVVKLHFGDDGKGGKKLVKYELTMDAHPSAMFALEASTSLCVKYLGGWAGRQEIFVFYVKGARLDTEGDLGLTVQSRSGSLVPQFPTPRAANWRFSPNGAPITEGKPLDKPDALREAYADVEALGQRLKDKLPPPPEEADEPQAQEDAPALEAPHAAIPTPNSGGKLEAFSGMLLDVILPAYNDYHKQTWGEWLWSRTKGMAEATALSSLKQKLQDGQLQWLTSWLTSTFVGKTYGFGKALNLKIMAVALTPDGGLRLDVRPHADVFGSKFTADADVSLQWDLFHKHVWHYEVDFQAESWAPRAVAPWRVRANDLAMTFGAQKLAATGIDVKGNDFTMKRATLDLALPEAFAAPPIQLAVDDLHIGDGITWGLLGGATKAPVTLGERVTLKSLAVGSERSDETQIFGKAALEAKAFKETISGDLLVGWKPKTRELIGGIEDLSALGQTLSVGFSNNGVYFPKIDLDVLKVLSAVPGSDVVPLEQLKVGLTGLAIQKHRIALEQAKAKAKLKPLRWGPLALTEGELGLSMGQNEATGFSAAGNVALTLWGKEAAKFGGTLAFKGTALDRELSKITAPTIDLGAVEVGAESIAPLPEKGFEIVKPNLDLGFAHLDQLPGIGDKLPSWLKVLKDFQVNVSADGYNSQTGEWTGLKVLPISIAVPMGSGLAKFSFDPKSGSGSVVLPGVAHEWSPSIGMQLPLLHGLAGVEVRGKLNLGVGLKETQLAGAYDKGQQPPKATAKGSLGAFMNVGAEVQAGIFAGIPHALSVSGGLFAEVKAATDVTATTAAEFTFGGGNDYKVGMGLDASAKLTAGAGAYVAYTILGYRGEKKFPIATKDLMSARLKGELSFDKGGFHPFEPVWEVSGLLAQEGPTREELEKEIRDAESDYQTTTQKVGETHKLLELIDATPDEQLLGKMREVHDAFAQKIATEQDPTAKARLENVQEVWRTNLLVRHTSKSEVTTDLARRRQRMYEHAMQLLHAKTVGVAQLRDFAAAQLAESQDELARLQASAKGFTEATPESEKTVNKSAQAKAEGRITEFSQLLARSGAEDNAFEPKAAELTELAAAVKANPQLLLDARAALEAAKLKQTQAMGTIKELLAEQQQAQEQSGILRAQTREDVLAAEAFMQTHRGKWYGARDGFFRKLVGLRTDSRYDEAMQALRTADLEFDFATRKLALTEKLNQ